MKFAYNNSLKRHERTHTGCFIQLTKEEPAPFLDDIKVEPLENDFDPLEIKSEPLENKYCL